MKNPLDMLHDWQPLWRMRFGKNFILEIPQGSLREHLILSHLPELLIKNGLYEKVYISTYSAYQFPDLFDLVWKSNPYIVGTMRKHGWKNQTLQPPEGNVLDEIVYQFTKTKPSATSTHPTLHNKEQFRKYATERYYLIDFNQNSTIDGLDPDKIRLYIEQAIISTKEHLDIIYVYKSPLFDEILEYSSLLQKLTEKGLLKVLGKEKSLHDYFSRIKNTKHFFCLYGGGALLAGAFKTPTTVFCTSKDTSITLNDQEYITSV